MEGKCNRKVAIHFQVLNPLGTNPSKWSNTLKQLAAADELFEYVWLFCGVGA